MTAPSFNLKVFLTFSILSRRLSRVCDAVSTFRTRRSAMRSDAHIETSAFAIRSLWLYPRSRSFRLWRVAWGRSQPPQTPLQPGLRCRERYDVLPEKGGPTVFQFSNYSTAHSAVEDQHSTIRKCRIQFAAVRTLAFSLHQTIEGKPKGRAKWWLDTS